MNDLEMTDLLGIYYDDRTEKQKKDEPYGPSNITEYANDVFSNAHSVGWNNNIYFDGRLKSKVANFNKPVFIFIIEYLYGIKVSKSKRVREIREILAAQPRTDFGFKKYTQIQRLMSTSRWWRGEELYTHFKGLGLEPKTDLKRWFKVIGINGGTGEEIIKIVTK